MISIRSVRRLPILAAAVVMAWPALAQDISESHQKAARAALTAIKATDGYDAILPASAFALRQELIQKNPDQEPVIDAVVAEKTIALASRRADLEREAAIAYARVFSEEELNQIAAFYTSPAGQKLIADGPIVTRQITQAANIWQNGIMRDLSQAVGDTLKAQLGDLVETNVNPQLPALDGTTPAPVPAAPAEGTSN